MKSSEWEVMSVEGNKESTAVIVGTNTTVLSPDIPIRISYTIIAGIWSVYNTHCAFFGDLTMGYKNNVVSVSGYSYPY